jgi:hypothetical protein
VAVGDHVVLVLHATSHVGTPWRLVVTEEAVDRGWE